MALTSLQKAGLMALSLAAPRRLAERFLRPPVQPMTGQLVTSGESRRIEFPVGDAGCCRGWWLVPPEDGGADHVVIVAHGWTSHALRMSGVAEKLVQAGYPVMLYNARSHGDSDQGTYVSMAHFAADLSAAAIWARSRASHVAVLGHSMGAGAAIIAAADGAPVEAVVALAPPSHPVRASADLARAWGIDGDLLMRRLGPHVEALIGRKLESFAPELRIPDVTCPVLIVHGTADEVVPVAHLDAITTHAGANVETLRVDGASHDGVKAAPPTWPRIQAFLAKAFPLNRQSMREETSP